MFIAHYGVAMGAKRIAPRLSLGLLIGASSLVDLLWPLFLLTGLEEVAVAPGITRVTPLDFVAYPWTHSLLGVAAWGLLFGGGYALLRNDVAGGLLLAGLTVSHWLLDLVAHRPDLPIYPGGEKYGFGLWNSLSATLAVEYALFAGGAWLFWRTAAPTGRRKVGFIALVAFLAVMYVANLVGPPPPGATAIGVAGLALWLLVWAGFAIDPQRKG
ncbi:MAG: hypothetical protein HQK87_04495 [Nitrospinae bacterium]|nr:hypothetical protein [Nitrospinota bacterium]